MRDRHSSSSVWGVPSMFSFLPYRWIFSQLSLTLVRPSVADEPFRKWPSRYSSSRFLDSLGSARRRVSLLPHLTNKRAREYFIFPCSHFQARERSTKW